MGWFRKWLETSGESQKRERACEGFHLTQIEVDEYMALAQEQGDSMPRFGTCSCGYYPTMPNA
ncbi:hypothetical protein ACGFZH_11190 [Streptomyces zaomyceticus]|uniref:hypothetical protein n=1 Tax=Streptomyces TaxID=1883 RepID=UPI00371A398D